MRLVLLMISCCFFSGLLAAAEVNEQQIEQRIQAVGKVHIQAEAAQVSGKDAKNAVVGQKVYERFCVVCHRDGLVGAPKFHDEQAWKSRLSGRTLEELVASAMKGLNAMPAKGTCYECNEDDIKSAVEYMLPNHD